MHVRTPSAGTLGGLQAVLPVVAGPCRERRKPKPMMNGLKKSDEAVRPAMAANKGAHAPAEPPEERASTKGNPGGQSTHRTQCRASVTQAADRIRQAAERNPKERHTALFHHVTPEALAASYFALRQDAAVGGDGVTWAMYGEGLYERLLDLHRRLHSGGAYRAPPVRRVEIPKPDGGTRPLGIAALEDKIVQKAVVDVILTPVYEVEFLGFSYGFRPGRGAHVALDALAFGIERRKVSWIVDADLEAYFDTISRDWLITILEHRIGDRRVIRLIRKWLDAGVMDGGSWTDAGAGTPQGTSCPPAWRTCSCTTCSICGFTGNGVQWFRRAKRSSFATRTMSWSGSNTSGMRSGTSATSGSGWTVSASASTRTRPASSSSDGLRQRTVTGAGQAGRRRSTSWLHALLHDDPAGSFPAWSQIDREKGQQDPGAHRRGPSRTLASRAG